MAYPTPSNVSSSSSSSSNSATRTTLFSKKRVMMAALIGTPLVSAALYAGVYTNIGSALSSFFSGTWSSLTGLASSLPSFLAGWSALASSITGIAALGFGAVLGVSALAYKYRNRIFASKKGVVTGSSYVEKREQDDPEVTAEPQKLHSLGTEGRVPVADTQGALRFRSLRLATKPPVDYTPSGQRQNSRVAQQSLLEEAKKGRSRTPKLKH